ncbi:MAG TPA: DEAD/DEAH box helicase [Casimicrobiaceae bacterium]|nr:DEAD/DEAH box helicase [Casimicrobiaceae bacterium]
MTFSTLGLSEALLRAVADQGYTVPTPIQRQAIPAVLAGGDLLAGAQTGTGKTAGFVLPMLQRLSTHPSPYAARSRKPLRTLILTPTRELAAQVEASIRTYGKHLKLTSMALFGGVGFAPQAAQLKRGVDILVATPGRLLDHHGQGNVDFSRVEIFVLDEADRMLDMGFIPDVKRVLALLPKQRQNLLFSATFSAGIRSLAEKLLNRPRTIEVTPPNSTVDAIAQRVHPVNREDKSRLLAWLVGHHRWRQVLVFTRTKHGADKLVSSLHSDGIRAVALHGNKSQNARTRALGDFKAGGVAVMVATDIAARGIDIDQLPHVVNYDLPNVPEDYVHRIGRTGRAGADGEAISLVCIDEHLFLRDIERLIKRSIPRQVIPGFEPDPNAVAQPVFAQRGRRPAQGERPGPRRARSDGHGPGRAPTQGGPRHASTSSRPAHSGQQPGSSRGGKAGPAVGPALFHSRPRTKH